ncbi:hypothetical protein Srot_0644 [Segniliparus rotundus DSM 44985]|uniref:Uncharacterized protein n=1 Tax=Segniliparus rotundus (strain ATCC BAA-972 / CDC 1076 / CIP 108378 / DSM 44985 / JCM 13578) TaxID=640132 RepID=D6ZCT4_SEGRD|nr:hypothetical protein [Segniliparus rotundus]ADG97126.1 hypothetical protein Srot_0644 [Segniliparus rotundus DSM 44985]
MSNTNPRPGEASPANSPTSFISCAITSAILIVFGFTLGNMFGVTVLLAIVIGIYVMRSDDRWRNIGKGITAAALAAFLFYFGWTVFYVSVPGAIVSIFQIGQQPTMMR